MTKERPGKSVDEIRDEHDKLLARIDVDRISPSENSPENLLPHAEPFQPVSSTKSAPSNAQRDKQDAFRSEVDTKVFQNQDGSFGQESPTVPEMGNGTAGGERSPGFDAIRGANDVAGSMATYQSQLVSVLTTIQKLLMETTARLEALEGYFDRLR
jgi:hypothetical protein